MSTDDYYHLYPNNLLVWETTNSIFNRSLYEYVQPNTSLTWMRTLIANRMATSGQTWCNVFARYNSGTYNNQWGVVNYGLYKKGMSDLPANTLWILEQVPGLVVSNDMTSALNTEGYWASYNVPYYPEIFNISEYPKMVKRYGAEYSYEECARALIFKRDAPIKAIDWEGMKFIMRENNYTEDPLSQGNPSYAISSRFDLMTDQQGGASPYGGLDAKLANSEFFANGTCIAISGPTYESLPPFNWSNWKNPVFAHYGQPNYYNFPWENMPSGTIIPGN